MRYRLRTLLILLTVGPVVFAGCYGPFPLQSQPSQTPPALTGSWTSEGADPAITLTFSAPSDLQLRDESGQLIRKFAYEWRSERLLQLSIDDRDFMAKFLLTVERGSDDQHLVLSVPVADAAIDQETTAGLLHQDRRLVLKRVDQ
jgi:hypothetical protein